MKKAFSVIIFIIFACLSFLLIQLVADRLGLETIYAANDYYEEETAILGLWQTLISLFIGYLAVRFIIFGNFSIRNIDGDKLAFYIQSGDNQSVSFARDKITWGSLQIQLEGLTISSANDFLVEYNTVA